jgi:hypothetical protein
MPAYISLELCGLSVQLATFEMAVDFEMFRAAFDTALGYSDLTTMG